jgi:outer membrane immunogenic protein
MRKLLLSSAACLAVISTASAADLRPITKAPPMPPPPPPFSWTGFYIGANVGGKFITNNNDARVDVPGDSFLFSRNDINSVMGGGQIGYNWQFGQWVIGIEGDADGQDLNRTTTVGTRTFFFVPGDNFTFQSDWQASLRGRIGYAFDRVLIYATGGAAWTQVKGTVNLVGLGSFTNDDTVTGGTVGGGIEWAVWNQVSLGIEGRYTFYGSQTFTGVLGGVAVSHTFNDLNTAEVMGKINFRFW